jgi:predicted GTPase
MNPAKNNNYIQRLTNITQKYIETIGKTDRQSVRERFQPLIDRLSLGLFRIVVMGEIKKGKSSFINALLGEYDILPTESDVATSTVFKLMYGPKHAYYVYFLPGNGDKLHRNISDPEPLPITRDQLWEYGTEKGNPGNKKNVDFIGIELPNDTLKKGIVIVDTPGVGGLFKNHREITLKYVPRADAVFFILDSVESVISEGEIKFLKELMNHTKNVFFIQTKIDAAGEEQWTTWRKRNLDILSEELKLETDKIPYFPVSSKIKVMSPYS